MNSQLSSVYVYAHPTHSSPVDAAHLLLRADLASTTAGVAESVLARVLDAFQAHMNGLLFGSAVQGLVANGTLARLMAAEPAASLAGDPVAFFAGRPGDSIDAFVTEVVTAGGDAACRCLTGMGEAVNSNSGTLAVCWVVFCTVLLE